MIKTIIAVILLIAITLVPLTSSYAVSNLEISVTECPQRLVAGERQDIAYKLTNIGTAPLNVTKIEILKDYSFDAAATSYSVLNQSSTIINPQSSLELQAKFRDTNLGLHYVDIRVGYYTNTTGERTEQHQLCMINVIAANSNKDATIDQMISIISSPLMIAFLLPIIAGAVGYFLKRSFQRKDLRYQEDIQHRTWLLQHNHNLAKDYYIPMAKFGYEALLGIERAGTSQDLSSIKIAYYYICKFLIRYKDFENKMGSNYLFEDRAKEEQAITLTRAIMNLLPFDQQDINEIVSNSSVDKECIKYDIAQFTSFSNWIKSPYCKRSKNDAIEMLRELQELLDKQGERISHPDYFMESKNDKSKTNRNESETEETSDDPFWILHISPKHLKEGVKVKVFGTGFSNKIIKCQFFIGDKPLQATPINDSATDILIPSDIQNGTYDIYSIFNSEGSKVKETIGIVIHIERSKDIASE